LYPVIDLRAVAQEMGADLDDAFERLGELYTDVDARNTENTRDLDLPCHRGCDMCCHESVFLTPLEFFFAWEYVQTNFSDADRQSVIEQGLRLYAENKERIDALSQPPPDGEGDHLTIARELRFTCPLLGSDGACRIYPARELYARLFGCSFNDQGGIYGCHLVGEHLAGKTVTLLPVLTPASLLSQLPLTDMRQVYPFYINALYC